MKKMKSNQKLNEKSIDKIEEMILAGITITTIAKSLDVQVSTLLEYLKNDPARSARADSARRESAKVVVDNAEDLLHNATDKFTLYKSNLLAHHMRWKASKIAPREFGDKVEVENSGSIGLVVEVVDFTKSE
jgi:hypothetical protein